MKKTEKIKAGLTVNKDVYNKFKAVCNLKGKKYTDVVNELMLQYINNYKKEKGGK